MDPLPCATCAARARTTDVRDHGMSPVDTTLGLTAVGGDIYACPSCDLRYRRSLEPATRFHDYDQYFFTQLDAPPPTVPRHSPRCPECGSADAGPEESLSALEFTFMQCHACGHGGLVDSWQRDLDGYVAETAPAFGCARCTSADAVAAWEATRATRVEVLEQESHYSVQIMACDCGQPYAVVFTERVDWQGGEDDQTWLAVPITASEYARLRACGEGRHASLLSELVRARRFLVRAFPTAGPLSVWWREDGFSVGPHD